jgi:hypothetical protein
MPYMLLIYGDEAARAHMTQQEQEVNMAARFQYTSDLQQSGKMLGGDALQPTATATTVRAGNAKTLLSGGPFAETKEQLVGYCIIDAIDRDEAVAWAARMPNLSVWRQGSGTVQS